MSNTPMYDDDGTGRTNPPNRVYVMEKLDEYDFEDEKEAMVFFMRAYRGTVNPACIRTWIGEWFAHNK